MKQTCMAAVFIIIIIIIIIVIILVSIVVIILVSIMVIIIVIILVSIMVIIIVIILVIIIVILLSSSSSSCRTRLPLCTASNLLCASHLARLPSLCAVVCRGGFFAESMLPLALLFGGHVFTRTSMCLQFGVDYWLIIRQLPKPIRALRNQEWLWTCSGEGDSDLPYSAYPNTNIPCAQNIVLIAALCFPVFLVVQFDTGIFYQVGVFLYGCMNGLMVLGLGQVVAWNDLVKQFEKGSAPFAL
jgi:hypothetical protein